MKPSFALFTMSMALVLAGCFGTSAAENEEGSIGLVFGGYDRASEPVRVDVELTLEDSRTFGIPRALTTTLEGASGSSLLLTDISTDPRTGCFESEVIARNTTTGVEVIAIPAGFCYSGSIRDFLVEGLFDS